MDLQAIAVAVCDEMERRQIAAKQKRAKELQPFWQLIESRHSTARHQFGQDQETPADTQSSRLGH
jgi:hypothetical protein